MIHTKGTVVSALSGKGEEMCVLLSVVAYNILHYILLTAALYHETELLPYNRRQHNKGEAETSEQSSPMQHIKGFV